MQQGNGKNVHPDPTSIKSVYQGLRLYLDNSSNEETNGLTEPNKTNFLRRFLTEGSDSNVDLGPYATNWYYVDGSDVCTNDGGVDTQTGEHVIHRVHWVIFD